VEYMLVFYQTPERGHPEVYAETPEIIGGYFMIEVASRDEALEIAKGCPRSTAEAGG
jgi:hypothetical protein